MSSLDMSLDDLAKRGGGSRGGRGGRGGSRGGASQEGSGPIRNKQRFSGGGQQDRGAARQPYARAPQSTPLQYAPIQLAYAPSAGSNGQWQHDLAPPVAQAQPAPQPTKKISGDTIHVSNLAPDVSDDDVREIFERIGKVTSCVVNFNSQGRSTGTATVTFAKKSDAEKAVEDYDEAEVDGRPMKLKLVGQVVSAPVVVKKQRPQVVQAAPAPQIYLPQSVFQQAAPLQYAQSYQQRERNPKPAPARGGASRGGRGGRGGASDSAPRGGRGGARGGRGGHGGDKKKEVTGADLDAEMDNYHKQREAAAEPTPAAAGQPTSA